MKRNGFLHYLQKLMTNKIPNSEKMNIDFIRSSIVNIYFDLGRRQKRWILRTLDLVCCIMAIYTAFSFRYDIFSSWKIMFGFQLALIATLAAKNLMFSVSGMYRSVLRYSGIDFFSITLKGVIAGLPLIVSINTFLPIEHIPVSILFIDSVLTLVLILTLRIFIRWFILVNLRSNGKSKEIKNVLIYGAGKTGSQLVETLSTRNGYEVLGFVDDNPKLYNNTIMGKRIYPFKKIAALDKESGVDLILLAIPSVSSAQRQQVLSKLRQLSIQIKTVPSLTDIITGKVAVQELRDIDICDLLGREEVPADPYLLMKNIKGKVVMVTGAGGSIGSELCRQIAQLEPEALILYERNELALYNIDLDLRENYPLCQLHSYLGSVTYLPRVEEVIQQHEVDTIYHAAAYKHVPLVEGNPAEGIQNNVVGTLYIAQTARKFDVETVVLISTDKAVRPANVMGASKRVAELILQVFASEQDTNTIFTMVRFGNVLDSSGSVVPRFREQIGKRMSLTVTHKEVTRYFMSITEAVRLVIQAGAAAYGRDVFVLDMGKPIRIYDLAEQMIELSGLVPGEDISIEITGLREGEKLYEELLIDVNNSTKTMHPKIFSAHEKMIPAEKFYPLLNQLINSIHLNNRHLVLHALKALVPEFSPQDYKFSRKLAKKVAGLKKKNLRPDNVISF